MSDVRLPCTYRINVVVKNIYSKFDSHCDPFFGEKKMKKTASKRNRFRRAELDPSIIVKT